MNSDELSERFLNFAAEIIKLFSLLSKTYVRRHIGGQLVRAATSAGANYEEARGAESRADFMHKLQIVLKELRESLYWLRLIKRTKLIQSERINPLISESKELTNIIAKSVVTAKAKK
ncbi:MAG: four helix bundle protein [Candidatus Marinimicrobia bacterium]|nr:four helix bundle protein [Candidatus Neomarinimicrobiota bacterium]